MALMTFFSYSRINKTFYYAKQQRNIFGTEFPKNVAPCLLLIADVSKAMRPFIT